MTRKGCTVAVLQNGTPRNRLQTHHAMIFSRHRSRLRGHTLMEVVVAMVASAVLLAGLGSVMFIAAEVAYTPSAAVRRTESADVVNQISEELRYATLIIQKTPQILEFVVADRNNDGTAEKIRYAWSGTPGDPLYRTFNTAAAVAVLDSVNAFSVVFTVKPQATSLTTTVESAEQVLASNSAVQIGIDRDVTPTSYIAHQVFPSFFAGIPANAVSWNATKVDFYGSKSGATIDTLVLQLRATGDPNDEPTSYVLGEASVSESQIGNSPSWNTIVFPTPIRNLTFTRRYALVWGAIGAAAARVRVNDSLPTGVLESNDSGGSWQYNSTRQLYGQIYGTYTTPGPTYNVTRNHVTDVQLVLQSGEKSHARIDAAIPLLNRPELLSAYWRADFDRNPTTTNANGDSSADWVVTGGGSFNPAAIINGIWYAAGALETRPLNDFTTTTIVDVRCRNTTVGGNGAVICVNADRQGGQYAPLLVYVQRQSDDTQTLTLHGRTSDSTTNQLFTRPQLTDAFIRVRLMILPQNNLVNLQINGEDQGTYTYSTYAPSSSTDRFVTLYGDSSLAEFDYVDVRVATN